VIKSFANTGTEDVFNGIDSRAARQVCPSQLWHVARRKLDQLAGMVSLRGLLLPPGNHLEALKGDRRGQYSIRLNQKFRICFVWASDGPRDVELVNYH
jgi:toxin HigB-1